MELILKELFTPAKSPKHHAFLWPGEVATLAPLLRQTLISDWGAPAGEVLERVFDKMVVDDSREFKTLLGAPLTGSQRYIIFGFNDITPEAAQALLKVLEEPPAGFIFFIITRELLLLPATIISRVWLVGEAGESSKVKFFTLSPAERLAVITKTLDKLDEADESARNYALNVLNSVEEELNLKLKKEPANPKWPVAAAILYESRESLRGVRVSVKLILERLALGLPSL